MHTSVTFVIAYLRGKRFFVSKVKVREKEKR